MTHSPPAVLPLRLQLVALADAYAAAKGISRSRISTIVLSGGHVLDLIASEGRDVTTATFERAVKFFDDGWPVDAPWPDVVARPSLVAQAASTEAA